MTTPARVGTARADYDAVHAGLHTSPLMRTLWATALGDQYPAEVEPFGSCSWWVLSQAVAGLRLGVEDQLVDLGCGRGGPGLWLARAMGCGLTGVDFSPVAVDLATRRAEQFLPPGRARFVEAALDATTLPDRCAGGVVGLDTLAFAPDRAAALREIRRILTPGGRAVLTVSERPRGSDDWATLAGRAGLAMETLLVNPHHDEHWQRLYALWREHAPQLRRELGEHAVRNLLAEVEIAGPRLGERRPLLIVLAAQSQEG